jgi:hypothetical protein
MHTVDILKVGQFMRVCTEGILIMRVCTGTDNKSGAKSMNYLNGR